MQEKYGSGSPEMQAFWQNIQLTDSLNQIEIAKILEKEGWPETDKIGRKGSQTIFLVIQHAPLPMQEKYLPLMRDAVKKGNVDVSSLALLEDRVALRKGGLQKYGSQIGFDDETNESYVLPLEDPERVNERRASVGLGTIEEYVSRWKIKWDPEDYKKKLAGYIAKQKPW
jgi:flagellar basal body rod protein FlgC